VDSKSEHIANLIFLTALKLFQAFVPVHRLFASMRDSEFGIAGPKAPVAFLTIFACHLTGGRDRKQYGQGRLPIAWLIQLFRTMSACEWRFAPEQKYFLFRGTKYGL
jgi:hypothetical protein